MAHSVEAVKLNTAWKELSMLVQAGTDYVQALRHVKRKYQLENSIELELRYQRDVYLVDRTDEVMNDLANVIEQRITETYKPTLLKTLSKWIGLKKEY
jgi:type II secretory pathway component PulF